MVPIRDINPSRSFPLITAALIATNCWIFVEHYEEGAGFVHALNRLGYVPAEGFSWERALSSMFMHGGWLHLLFNMWTLWVFGDNVEDGLGKVGYTGLYLGAGIGAIGLHHLLYPLSEVPVVGASGAISGVMGAYLVLYPRARVYTWIPPWFFTALSARVFLILWFVLQLVQGTLDRFVNLVEGDTAGVAFWAHVGGFVVGWGVAQVFPRRPHPSEWQDLGLG